MFFCLDDGGLYMLNTDYADWGEAAYVYGDYPDWGTFEDFSDCFGGDVKGFGLFH